MTRLRSIAFLVFLLAGTPLMAIVYAPAALLSERGAYLGARHWAKLMLGALKTLCGVRIRIEGREFIPTDGAIVASNHQSMWETIALYAILPTPVMAFKKELLNNPVYRIWGRHAGIAVDRNAGSRAIRALVDDAKRHLERGKQIVLFPEGTRTPPGEFREFQPGVAAIYRAANVKCVPAAHNSGVHWLHPGPLKTPGEIIIRFLPPIEPGLDRKEMLPLLERRIADARASLPTAPTADPSPDAASTAQA